MLRVEHYRALPISRTLSRYFPDHAKLFLNDLTCIISPELFHNIRASLKTPTLAGLFSALPLLLTFCQLAWRPKES
jgi:hypothetical protein